MGLDARRRQPEYRAMSGLTTRHRGAVKITIPSLYQCRQWLSPGHPEFLQYLVSHCP